MAPKLLTIKSSREFKIANQIAKKYHAPTLIVLVSPTHARYHFDPEKNNNSNNFCRFGITVSKTVSKSACVRNLCKRRIREAFKKLASQYVKNNFDYVIIAKKQITEIDYKNICNDLKFCLKRLLNS